LTVLAQILALSLQIALSGQGGFVSSLSLRCVKGSLRERSIDVSHETVQYWWNRITPTFAAEIRRKRVRQTCAFSNQLWLLNEIFIQVNAKRNHLGWAVDYEGDVN